MSPDYVSGSLPELLSALEEIRTILEALAHNHHVGDLFDRLFENASQSLVQETLTAMPFEDPTGSGPNRLLAMHLADTTTQEWQQNFYRLAVLITKLSKV